MSLNNKINPDTEKYVQTEQGLRIEGKEKIADHVYTWMRYVNTKTMDDLKRN